MDVYMIVLRLLHILGGIFWVGTTLFFVLFFEPVIKAAGPAGGTIMGKLALTRFSPVMGLSSSLTVVAGFLMYWNDSNSFQGNWILSTPGIVLTIGSIAGILASIVGLGFQMPASARIAALQKEMQAAGGPPEPAQLAELQALTKKISTASCWGAVLMVIAVIGMAGAREFGEI